MSQEILDQFNSPQDFRTINYLSVPGTLNVQGSFMGTGFSTAYFVDATNGNDNNDGRTLTTAYATIPKAYAQLAGAKNEVVYLVGNTTAASVYNGGTPFVWAKNYTHLVGLCAPVALGQRARITAGVSTQLVTPMITFSGIGCIVSNIEFFQTGSDTTGAAVCVLVTGVRNAFYNCQISGGGTTASAGNAAMRSLVLGATTPTAADENFFKHCYIGLDTIARTTTTVEMEVLGGTARVHFEDCTFSTYATGSGSGAVFVKVGVNGMDRHLKFKNCQFINPSTLSGGVALSDALSISATPGGVVLITGSLFTGCTALSASDAAIFGDNAYAAATTAKAVNLSW